MDFLKKCIAVLVLFSIFSFFITIFEKIYFEKNKYNEIAPLIITLSGGRLTEEEKEYIAKINPFGFIFFSNNLYNKTQTKRLIKDIKKTLRRSNVFFMIDQEGGKISRLEDIYDKKYEKLKYFGELYKKNPEEAKEKIFEYAKDTAKDMANIGLNLNLSPIIDIGKNDNNKNDDNPNSIQNRIISDNIEAIVELAKEYNKGLMENNVYGCMKHLPGLGSGNTDTHKGKDLINKSLDELKSSDFVPFRKLAKEFKFGLIGLATYNSIDSENIAALSKPVIKVIRKDIGFDGIIISDAFSMGAVKDISANEKVLKALDAGVDVVMIDDVTLQEALGIKNLIPRLKLRFFNRKLKSMGLR